MWIAKTVVAVRRLRSQLSGKVVLVPTMGALHAGHLALVERGRQVGDHVIVSIFVNPTQFGPGEDYERYPRMIDRDQEQCESAGAAGIFAPEVAEMYPSGAPACEVSVPELAGVLEGQFRPGHFAGVCRVVAKLLLAVSPDLACFGRKDYQQLKIVQAMVDDLMIPCAIEAVETVREPDGLALSSRNAYLDADGRRKALSLFKALTTARRMIEEEGETDPATVERAMRQTMEAGSVKVDYAAVRHPQTLRELDSIAPALTGGVAALVAGRVGAVRLIDNMFCGGR